MISHEYKCIFVHQAKCAGTTILKTFGLSYWSHPDVDFMNAGVRGCNADYPGYFRFSCVRNPYDRFVSGWKYCHFTKYRTLLDVLRHMPMARIQSPDQRDPNFMLTEDFANIHVTQAQHERLLREDGKLGVDFLIRYERLQEDFNHVCDVIGKPRVILSRENTTWRQPYRTYFDRSPEARELLEHHFRRDFELFGYHY
jgi:hypothetical protein